MKDMGVDHRRFDIAMPRQLLEGSNVGAAFKEVRGKRMPECVARGPVGKTSFRHGPSDSFLHQGFVNVMAPWFLSPAVHPSVFLGKDPLPTPVLRRVGVLPVECVWRLDTPLLLGQISLVNRFHLVQVDVEWS